MRTTFKHSGKYTSDSFTIDEVVASLSAQKVLLEEGLNFLAELDPDFTLDKVTVRVDSLATGSLIWDLLIEVYGEYQTQIEEKVVGSLEEMFGVDIPPEYEGVATLAALAVTYVVARYAYDRVARSKGDNSSAAPTITGDNNIVIWSSPGLMDTFSLMKESVFHAENEEPVPCGIQGADGCTCAHRAQC